MFLMQNIISNLYMKSILLVKKLSKHTRIPMIKYENYNLKSEENDKEKGKKKKEWTDIFCTHL